MRLFSSADIGLLPSRGPLAATLRLLEEPGNPHRAACDFPSTQGSAWSEKVIRGDDRARPRGRRRFRRFRGPVRARSAWLSCFGGTATRSPKMGVRYARHPRSASEHLRDSPSPAWMALRLRNGLDVTTDVTTPSTRKRSP